MRGTDSITLLLLYYAAVGGTRAVGYSVRPGQRLPLSLTQSEVSRCFKTRCSLGLHVAECGHAVA